MDFAVSADHRVKQKNKKQKQNKQKTKQNKNIDKYLDLARELKRTVKHENDMDTNCNWCAWNGRQKVLKKKKTGGSGWLAGWLEFYGISTLEEVEISH